MLCLPMLFGGCATSSNGPVAVRPALPDPPAALQTSCRDPGVPDIQTVADAVRVIGQSRVYAACGNRKARDLLTFYRDVQRRYR